MFHIQTSLLIVLNFLRLTDTILESGALVVATFSRAIGGATVIIISVVTIIAGAGLLGGVVGSTLILTLIIGLLVVTLVY